jgi:hypothetical protein
MLVSLTPRNRAAMPHAIVFMPDAIPDNGRPVLRRCACHLPRRNRCAHSDALPIYQLDEISQRAMPRSPQNATRSMAAQRLFCSPLL